MHHHMNHRVLQILHHFDKSSLPEGFTVRASVVASTKGRIPPSGRDSAIQTLCNLGFLADLGNGKYALRASGDLLATRLFRGEDAIDPDDAVQWNRGNWKKVTLLRLLAHSDRPLSPDDLKTLLGGRCHVSQALLDLRVEGLITQVSPSYGRQGALYALNDPTESPNPISDLFGVAEGASSVEAPEEEEEGEEEMDAYVDRHLGLPTLTEADRREAARQAAYFGHTLDSYLLNTLTAAIRSRASQMRAL